MMLFKKRLNAEEKRLAQGEALLFFKMVEGEGFEPSKADANRFTACPLWPLGYPSVSIL